MAAIMDARVNWTHLPHDALVAVLTAAAAAGPFTFCSAAATCRAFWAISTTDVKGLSVHACLSGGSAGSAALTAWLQRYAHHVVQLQITGAATTLLPLVEQLAAAGVTSGPRHPLCSSSAAVQPPPTAPAAADPAVTGDHTGSATPTATAAAAGAGSHGGHASMVLPQHKALPLEQLVLGGGLASTPGHTTHLLRHLPNLQALVLQEDWGGGLPHGLAGATGLTRFDWTVSSKEPYAFGSWSLSHHGTGDDSSSSSGSQQLPVSLQYLSWRSHHPHMVISQLLVNITHLTALTRLELAHSCGGLYDAGPLLALPSLQEVELCCSALQPPSDTLLMQLAPRLVGLQLQGGACRVLGCLTALTSLTVLGVAEEYLQGALPRLVALRRLVLSPRQLYLLRGTSVWSHGNWFGAPVAAGWSVSPAESTSTTASAPAGGGDVQAEVSQHHCQAGRLLSSCAGLRHLHQLHLLLGPCGVTPSAALGLAGLQQVTSLELSQRCVTSDTPKAAQPASVNSISSRCSFGDTHSSSTTSSMWQPWAAAVSGLPSLARLSLPLYWITSSSDWLKCLSDIRVTQVTLKCDAHTSVQEALLAVERLQHLCSLFPGQQQRRQQQLHVVLEGVPASCSKAVKHALAAWAAEVGDGSFTWEVCV